MATVVSFHKVVLNTVMTEAQAQRLENAKALLRGMKNFQELEWDDDDRTGKPVLITVFEVEKDADLKQLCAQVDRRLGL